MLYYLPKIVINDTQVNIFDIMFQTITSSYLITHKIVAYYNIYRKSFFL